MTEERKRVEMTSENHEATFGLGEKLGRLLLPSMVVGLNGTLGSGKTRMTQGIVNGVMSTAPDVVSPTYTLCIPYSGRIELLHLDAYRIVEDEEVFELGLDEALEDGKTIVIEWVDKIAELLPYIDLEIRFDPISERERRLEFDARTEKGIKLLEQLFGQ